MLKFLNSRIGGAITAITLLVIGLTIWSKYRNEFLMTDEATRVTFGYVLKTHSGIGLKHSRPSVTIGYTVNGENYKTSIGCSELLVKNMIKGTPFEIRYNIDHPSVANVNYTKRIKVGNDAETEAWIEEFCQRGEGVYEVVYQYDIDNMRYTGADFIQHESVIRRGDFFDVTYSEFNPQISKLIRLSMQSMDGVCLDSLAYYDSLRKISPTSFR